MNESASAAMITTGAVWVATNRAKIGGQRTE